MPNQPMRRVIVASPYQGEISENRKYARAAMRDSLARGESPIAFHLLYTQPGILDNDVEHERTLGLEAGHRWISVSDAVIFYVDNGMSPGMILAEKMAKATGILTEERRISGATSESGKPIKRDA